MVLSSSPPSRLAVALFLAFVCAGALRAEEVALNAMISVEVLPIDPAFAVGAISEGGLRWDNPRIALQPARVARAIVKDEKNGKGSVFVLALLGDIEINADRTLKLDVAPAKQAWCAFGGFGSVTVECYQDTDGDGKLETQRRGLLGVNESLGLARVGAGKSITPVAYRAATAAELPGLQVGYKSCAPGRDQVPTLDSELRFAALVQRVGMHMPPSQVCNDVAKPLGAGNDGEKLFQFGRFKVAIRENDAGKLITRLVEGIPPGTLLGHLRPGRPLLDATDTPSDLGEIAGDVPFLRMVSPPKLVETIKPGEEFFSAEVQHGITGKLTADSKSYKKNGPTLPAGTPVYGIAMSSSAVARSFDAVVVWCAPRKNAEQKLVAQCFAPDLSGFALYESDWSPYAMTAVTSYGYDGIAPPVVERGPVDFGGPLAIRLRYDAPTPKSSKKYLYVSRSTAPADAPLWQSLRLRRGKDDAGFVWLGDAILKIMPSADGASATVSVVGELKAGAAIDVPSDAVEMMRR